MNPFWTVSLFWIAAMVCVAVALAFVLPALLQARTGAAKAARRDVNIAVYRDQLKEMEADRANGLLSAAQFDAAKLELETRLADDALSADDAAPAARVSSRKLGYAMGAVLPVAAFGLYFWLGNPMSLIAIANAQPSTPHSATPNTAMPETPGQHDFMAMIRRVEEKTRANPQDGAAWAMLAKTYAATEQWPQALQAYEKAVQLQPQDASVLSGYAEALAVGNKHILAGKPMVWVKKSLAIDPEDIKGLELAGVNAFQEQDFAQAIHYFQKLHGLLPPESPYAQDILAAQKEAENRLAQAGGSAAGNPASPPVAAIIKGRIDIAPSLKSKLAATDVLFVFARTGEQGPPVAALRASVSQFPLEFELDDSMAMNPANTLSQQKRVMLVARVSKSGSPMAQSGDLEGTLSDVQVGESGVRILIDRARP